MWWIISVNNGWNKRAKNDNKINRLTYKENDILKNDMKSIDRAPSLSLILELENPC